jgi:hypothetical protein
MLKKLNVYLLLPQLKLKTIARKKNRDFMNFRGCFILSKLSFEKFSKPDELKIRFLLQTEFTWLNSPVLISLLEINSAGHLIIYSTIAYHQQHAALPILDLVSIFK